MSSGDHIERRAFAEVRTASGGRKLEGYAATFGAAAAFGAITEVIAPGAFRDAKGRDVLALLDHDMAQVLGRTRSGTLRLIEDARGLAFSLDLPDTTAGRNVAALAERGDLGGMSFGFMVPEGGERWDGERRTLERVDLREISVVSAFPAYPDTSLALRARADGSGRARRARSRAIAEALQCR